MPIRSEFRTLTRLALPIISANLGWMAIQFVDTLMVGRYSDEALAAVALAATWISGTLFLGVGIVMGMDPIVTQAHGARNGERLALALQRGLVLAVACGVVIGALWCGTEPFLLMAGQDPELAAIAGRYTLVQLPSAPAFLIYSALRQYLQGREILRPIVWVVLVANVSNALLNWMFIYGNLGCPELGVQGAGLATMLTRCMMPIVLIVIIRSGKLHHGAWVRWSRAALRWSGIRELLRLGIPSGIQTSLEMWAFGAAALMAGHLGKDEIAAHAIVINLASMSFMVPLGVSAAATTRVGNLIGAGKAVQAQTSAWCSILMGAGFMAISALIFALFRHELPRMYTQPSDINVRELSAIALPIAAAFQIFDGIQVVGSGILRGQGSTLPAAAMNLVGYWVLALPFAWWMAFRWDMGLAGIWWGLALGLAIVAICLLVWIRFRGPARTDLRPNLGVEG
ncbi:MAG: MATE family multidrug resistance protein [Planctomycetota bacterium]|jgi:MATE family multidrug resistance protein